MPVVCWRQRQEHDENVGRVEEGRQALVAVEGSDVRHGLFAAAPAIDAEAGGQQHLRGGAAELAETHDADRNVVRRTLRRLAPDLPLLLGAVEHALAVMVEHPPEHVFGHVLGEVVGDDAHDRHVRKRRVGEDVIDAGADREDRPQVGKPRQQVRALLPHHRIGDRRVVRRRPARARPRRDFDRSSCHGRGLSPVMASRMRPFSLCGMRSSRMPAAIR